MGDNRDISFDSRMMGPMDARSLLGKRFIRCAVPDILLFRPLKWSANEDRVPPRHLV